MTARTKRSVALRVWVAPPLADVVQRAADEDGMNSASSGSQNAASPFPP